MDDDAMTMLTKPNDDGWVKSFRTAAPPKAVAGAPPVYPDGITELLCKNLGIMDETQLFRKINELLPISDRFETAKLNRSILSVYDHFSKTLLNEGLDAHRQVLLTNGK